jgi:3-dehydroquinate dehydratase I
VSWSRLASRFSICVSIGETTAGRLQRQLHRAEEAGADIIEIRVDFLEHPALSTIRKCLNSVEARKILTCRASQEGGRFQGSEGARLKILRELSALGPEYLDVELSTLQEHEKLAEDLAANGCKLIASSHRTNGIVTLDNLAKTAKEATKVADLSKIIPRANTLEDNLKILALYRSQYTGRLVAFCLGKLGFLSRALCPIFGSPFTYAGLREEATAEGQPSIERLRRFYAELEA